MILPRIRQRLSHLADAAAAVLEEPEEVAPEPFEAPEVETGSGDPADHLRRALLSLQARDKTRPDPRVFGELRLMLNQLESGKLSRRLSSEIVVAPQIEAPKKPQRRSLRGWVSRGARALSDITRPG